MNKTLTINIAGLVFHIDENAYYKLDNYLKAIRRSFTQEEQDEIIHDIEIRIAELFTERITDTNQVITVNDVDAIINIMGKPEDYTLGDDETTQETQFVYSGSKKLYRDSKNGILGGVLSGLSHYLKIDVLWLRILFLILVLFYGTGVLLYFIFWIVVPKAKTTSQILEMEREPINISTIEKKVKDNIDYVTNKINDVDYNKIKQTTEKAGQKSAKWLKNLIGIFLIAISSLALLGIIIGGIATYVNKDIIITEGINNHIPFFVTSPFTYTLSTTLAFFIAAIPFIGLILIGLRLIYTNIRYVFATIVGLFIVWLVLIGAFAVPFLNMKNYDFNQFNSVQMDSKEIIQKINIDFPETEVLHIAYVTPAFFETDSEDFTNYLSTKIASDLPVDYEILPTYQNNTYVKINGDFSKTITTKNKQMALTVDIESIKTRKVKDTLVVSDTYLDAKDLEFKIYIPVGKNIYIDAKTKENLDDDDFAHIKENHTYKMSEDRVLSCTDC
ncbi:PspC domain-containing protein [Myroides pelagicus]|uniref:PspC domain-containing protein n=1 Tax=Myroides pelagicus TaxID=270914 RepID=UPI002DBBDE60|nr:PspC domain-containing protein [Myroides pelagicus]MEC4114716.1 PspC domain-containing protein [Myroides pelagicus]